LGESREQMQARLEKLRENHKSLDKKVTKLYNSYTARDELYRMKTMKLWLKDEINRIETKLKGQDGKGL
jgi:hypothetical protein